MAVRKGHTETPKIGAWAPIPCHGNAVPHTGHAAPDVCDQDCGWSLPPSPGPCLRPQPFMPSAQLVMLLLCAACAAGTFGYVGYEANKLDVVL